MARGSDERHRDPLRLSGYAVEPALPEGEEERHKPAPWFWPMVSPPDANWKAPYSARFHVGASAPGG